MFRLQTLLKKIFAQSRNLTWNNSAESGSRFDLFDLLESSLIWLVWLPPRRFTLTVGLHLVRSALCVGRTLQFLLTSMILTKDMLIVSLREMGAVTNLSTHTVYELRHMYSLMAGRKPHPKCPLIGMASMHKQDLINKCIEHGICFEELIDEYVLLKKNGFIIGNISIDKYLLLEKIWLFHE